MGMVSITRQSLYPQAKNPLKDPTGELVGPTAGLDILEKRYILFRPCRDSDLGSLIFINHLLPSQFQILSKSNKIIVDLNCSCQRYRTYVVFFFGGGGLTGGGVGSLGGGER